MRELLPAAEAGALGGDLAEMGTRVLSAAELGLCREAASVLDRARSRATRWEDAARGRYRAVREAARREGRAEGLEGAAADMADLSAGLAALEAELEVRARSRALEIVRALFDGLEEEARIVAAARRAMAENPGIGRGRLLVPPELVEPVEARLAAGADDASIEVAPDPALPRDAARLETPMGAIALDAGRQLALAATLLAPPAGEEAAG